MKMEDTEGRDSPLPGSPRMKLAMLSQVKGYFENLKGSLDSLKDEV